MLDRGYSGKSPREGLRLALTLGGIPVIKQVSSAEM